jgi:hypothetical protein
MFSLKAFTLSDFLARVQDEPTAVIQVFLALLVSIALMVDLVNKLSRRKNIDQ